jgi:hypothetical protein
MTPNPPDILRDRGRSLDDEFFRREYKRQMENLRALRAAEATREALAKASGITTPAVLDKLIELGIRAETVAALSIVPLLEVAWADGAIDPKERRAILERAGVPEDSTAGALLAAWLDRRPDPNLLTAWTHLVQAMSEQLGPSEAAPCQGGIAGPGARGCGRGRRDARCWFENFSRRGGDAGKARNRFPLECRP